MRQFRDWLHTGIGAPPVQYEEYILCTQLYHCIPSMLDDEFTETLGLHISMYSAINAKQQERIDRAQRRTRIHKPGKRVRRHG